MIETTDLITITLRKYKESSWGWRWMGTARRALDFGKYSIIIELWYCR